jgi:serine/threonine protein phosphatase PrpC
MTDPSKLSIDFAAITDIGCERSNNEDSYGYDADQHLYVVCDGMGGRAAGEVASGMAVRTLIESFAANATFDNVGEAMPVENRLLQAILDANQAVCEAGAQSAELRSMGTTLVCVCLDSNRAVIGNVGDSRAYLIREGNCVQVTQDHSLLAEAVRAGEISAETAANSNLQSIITRAIGVEDAIEPDLYAAQLLRGDILLLATDGLTRYMQSSEISVAVDCKPDLTASCQALIEVAKQRGGADNITCILLRVVEERIAVPADGRFGEENDADSETPPDGMEAFTPII